MNFRKMEIVMRNSNTETLATVLSDQLFLATGAQTSQALKTVLRIATAGNWNSMDGMTQANLAFQVEELCKTLEKLDDYAPLLNGLRGLELSPAA